MISGYPRVERTEGELKCFEERNSDRHFFFFDGTEFFGRITMSSRRGGDGDSVETKERKPSAGTTKSFRRKTRAAEGGVQKYYCMFYTF